jgi:methyl-accepting chemotaxis protein
MFNRLKIASKLLIGFGLILLLLAGIASLSVFNGIRAKGSIEDLSRRSGEEILDQRALKDFTEASAHAWIALATGDQEQWKQSNDSMETGYKRLDELAKVEKNPERSVKIKQLTALVRNFGDIESKFRTIHGRNDALNTDEGKALSADALKGMADFLNFGHALADEYQQLSAETASEAKDSANFIITLAAGIGLVSLLVGLTLAFLISRSIKQPIFNLTYAMSALAKGDLKVSVQNTTENNEIGEMARSVMVFKDNAVERARLEAEATAARAAAEAERERVAAERAKAAEEQAEAVRRLGEGLKDLAAGDLTVRLSDGFTDQYAQIKNDFNEAIDKLKQTMLSVVSSSSVIHSGTQEISAASDDLARRTEQQAASLEETAAALEEITTTVKKSAEGAAHARQVVGSADEDAKKSAVVMREAVAAMDAIAKSAQQISQIIGVIDEIAFQTNLLALNAGVEAARAGDAGRGFAVVASEVRALAQRSAEAAKEIKGLISASTTQVDHGVKLVAETGKSLERIMAQVTEINSVVTTIAAGAQEQSTGLQQINIAINQMDQTTQKNASMVEESTAASHSLSQETNQLSGLIGQFQVGSAGADAALRGQLQKAAPHAFRQPAKAPAGPRAEPRLAAGNPRPETRKAPSQPTRSASKAVANGAPAGDDSVAWEEF